MAADLVEMGSLSPKNKNLRYILCVIYVFTKYAWGKTLKDRKGKTALIAFIEIVNESNRKPNKLEFCNKLMQEWLDNNDVCTPPIAEIFVKALTVKIY